jgi:hypothetical protein
MSTSLAIPNPLGPGVSPSAEAFVFRVATIYFVVSGDRPPDVGLADKLKEALNHDARVTSVHVPRLDKGWSPQPVRYPATENIEDDDGVLDGRRHFHFQLFSQPIEFNFHVPAKNQPKVFEDDEIPTEDYFALWDGQSLIVSWKQPALDDLSNSGGHIVEDILETAVDRLDAGLYVQACNPQCKYVFVHTDARLTFDNTATGLAIHATPADKYLVEMVAPGPIGLQEATRRIWRRFGPALAKFADMKNVGRQIIDLERVIRWDLDRLNSLHFKRAEATQRGVRTRVAAFWEFRHWRSTSRFYLTRLWLALGSIERLRRKWSEEQLNFSERAAEADIEPLFIIDGADEAASIRAIDLRLVEAAVEHASSRLDSTALAWATAGGAVAGGIVAALITFL